MRYSQAMCVRPRKMAETGPLRFVAATEGLKGDGWDLQMGGADLSRYESNGVVLWAHDYSRPPIGRAEAWVENGQLLSDIEFDLADPDGARIDRKYRDGFLNAVSIGFDFNWREVDLKTGVVDRWELLEISAVPVPMDANALLERQARAAAPDPVAMLRRAQAAARMADLAAKIPGLPG